MTNQTAQAPTSPSGVGLDAGRYSLYAIILHWTIAALIVVQLFLGWWMNEWVPDHSEIQDQIQAVHVSLGLTIFILVLVRIVVRLAYRPPPLPAEIRGWERPLVNVTHSLFYVLLLVVPLTGWATISVSTDPISLWGLPWPRLPGLGFIKAHREWRRLLTSIHVYWLIWLVVINLALHVAGALRHQFDGHPVLWRMFPGGARR